MGDTKHLSISRESISAVGVFQVKPVEQPMSERRNENCCDGKECHACIEGIEGGKQLARHTGDLVDRTHPAQYHRGIHEGINPG